MLKKYLNSKSFYPYELYQIFMTERGKRIEKLKSIGFELIGKSYKRGKNQVYFDEIEQLTNIEFSEKFKNYGGLKEKKEYKKREKGKEGFRFGDEKPHFDINGINVGNIYFENVKVGTYHRQMFSDGTKYKYQVFLNNNLEIINKFLIVFKGHCKNEGQFIQDKKYYEISFSYLKVKD